MAQTKTKFDWPAGATSVQVSGDWDDWKEKINLEKQQDGSFAKEIPLPENKRVHYKFIVDDKWTTKQGAPTIDDAGNVNNIVDVGPAPSVDSSKQSGKDTSAAVGAGAAGGTAAIVSGTAAALAGNKSNGHAGTDETQKSSANASATPAAGAPKDEKPEPAQPLKQAADEDVRNSIPQSLTSATRTAVPVVASAVATVTGADILRGHPEELPVSNAEAQKVKADANAASTPSQQTVFSDASKAPTDNAKAGANAATTAAVNNKLDTSVVPVNEAGFAANVDGARHTAGKEGGDAAGAVASASQSTAPTTTTSPAMAASAVLEKAGVQQTDKSLPTVPSNKKQEPAAATSQSQSKASEAAPPLSNADISSSKPAAATAATAAPTGAPATSKAQTNGSASSTAASKVAKPASSSAAPAPAAAPTTPKKTGTVRDKFRTPRASESNTNGDTTEGSVKEHKRKGLLGKIKQALSPHSSPSK